MRQRGRPPHPDILTPRQWEVLDLLRRGLTDQQIADELGVTLAGAKYHVSEILTKLAVSSREQAAAWQPTEARAPWWRRALALSLAMKAIGGLVVAVTVVGLSLLTWAVASHDDSDTASAAAFDDLALPTPLASPTLTREQALVAVAGRYGGAVLAVDVTLTTEKGIDSLTGGSSPNADPNAPRWLVRYRGFIPGCAEGWQYVIADSSGLDLEQLGGGGSSVVQVSFESCSRIRQATSDIAIANAAQFLAPELQARLPDRISAEDMSFGEAVARVHAAGIGVFDAMTSPTPNFDRVWLVTMIGHFPGVSAPTPVPETPRPSPALPCRVAMGVVVQYILAEVFIAGGSAPSNDC